jgi:hypothetical protein
MFPVNEDVQVPGALNDVTNAVLADAEVVDCPAPFSFDGVIVNLYNVEVVKPMNVNVPAVSVVCVGVDDGGSDVMEYKVA